MNSIDRRIQLLLSTADKSRCTPRRKFNLNIDGPCSTPQRLPGYIKHDFTSTRLPQQYSLV